MAATWLTKMNSVPRSNAGTREARWQNNRAPFPGGWAIPGRAEPLLRISDFFQGATPPRHDDVTALP